MRSKIIMVIVLFLMNLQSKAQYVQLYYDQKTYEAVTENQFMRMANEALHTNTTKNIKESLDNINKNIAKVVVVRNQIYNSLVNVNEALKDGKELAFIVKIVKEISDQCIELGKMASGNPLYVAFANKQANNALYQSVNIFKDINQLILKEGNGLLMDYNTRDGLLRNLTQRLQLLRAEVYLANQTIYYAKINGLWSSLNPFKGVINSDMSIINDIMWKAKLIK